jgi:drug/metabolite transporter (DMT)-like permease
LEYNPGKNLFETLKGYKPELILFTISISWGFTFPLIKIVLNDVSVMAFVFIRFVITILFFYVYFRKELKNLDKTGLKHGLILGIYLFIGFYTQTAGLKYTTASKSAFITGTNIVLLPFVQMIIIKSKPNFGNVLGIILVLLGLYFLTEIRETKINFGDVITLLCAVAFAFHIVYLDKYSRTSGHLFIIYGQYISMVVLSFLAMIFFEVIPGNFYFRINAYSVSITFFTAVFSTLFALFLMMKYQKHVTPVRAGLIYNMEQVTAVISAYFILSEIMSVNQIAGAVIMTIGLIISEIFTKFKYAKVG